MKKSAPIPIRIQGMVRVKLLPSGWGAAFGDWRNKGAFAGQGDQTNWEGHRVFVSMLSVSVMGWSCAIFAACVQCFLYQIDGTHKGVHTPHVSDWGHVQSLALASVLFYTKYRFSHVTSGCTSS